MHAYKFMNNFISDWTTCIHTHSVLCLNRLLIPLLQVSRHLAKLFDSMSSLKFTEDASGVSTKEAVGMYSKDGEYVEFDANCHCDGQVCQIHVHVRNVRIIIIHVNIRTMYTCYVCLYCLSLRLRYSVMSFLVSFFSPCRTKEVYCIYLCED